MLSTKCNQKSGTLCRKQTQDPDRWWEEIRQARRLEIQGTWWWTPWVLFLPQISRLGDEEAGNLGTPMGADRKAPKKILLSLAKGPRKREPQKPHKPGSLYSSQISQKKLWLHPQPSLSSSQDEVESLDLHSPGYKELFQIAPSCQCSIREDRVITLLPSQSVEILGSLSFHLDPVVMRHNSPNCRGVGYQRRLTGNSGLWPSPSSSRVPSTVWRPKHEEIFLQSSL